MRHHTDASHSGRQRRDNVHWACVRATAAGVAAAFATWSAHAHELVNQDGLVVRWDNTLKYSSGLRLKQPASALISEVNQDDGNRNFGKGLISNRIDWLTEVDLTYRNVGARIPFPIPKSGLEVRWNSTLRWHGQSFETKLRHLSWTASGDKVLGTQAMHHDQMEFYRRGVSAEDHAKKGYLDWLFYQGTDAPSFRAGEALVTRGSSNYDKFKERGTWQYLVGQRRVRRAPSVGWDTPDFVNSGANFFDEVFGSPLTPNERYEYKLVGKKELLIPYNNNKIFTLKEDDIFGKDHHNPDAIRWELHRVWVVEAVVAPGKRHAVPRRMYYIDEDSWGTALMDGYDATGKIWRVSIQPAYYLPDMPGVKSGYSDILYVLDAAYSSRNTSFYEPGYQFKPVPMKPDSRFTPEALSGSAVR